MDISSVGGSELSPEIQAQYAVKLIKMAQQANAVTSSLIEDTVEISQEAMSKLLSELKI